MRLAQWSKTQRHKIKARRAWIKLTKQCEKNNAHAPIKHERKEGQIGVDVVSKMHASIRQKR